MKTLGFRWDRSSRTVLADALLRLGPNRCVAEVRPDEVLLTGPPTRRTAALLECGVALSTIWTVVRVLGREPVVMFPHDSDHPDVAAVVQAGDARATSSGEWARYVALHLERLGSDVTGHSSSLITTPGDSRRHHVLAGAALHSTRLAAASPRGCCRREGLATPKRRKP